MGGENQATSQATVAGWRRILSHTLLLSQYSSYRVAVGIICIADELGIYTQRPDGTKYYLKVCGDDQANSQTTKDGWREQFYFDWQTDGSQAIYTQTTEGTKYFLRVCGDNQANSETTKDGWCGRFYFDRSCLALTGPSSCPCDLSMFEWTFSMWTLISATLCASDTSRTKDRSG